MIELILTSTSPNTNLRLAVWKISNPDFRPDKLISSWLRGAAINPSLFLLVQLFTAVCGELILSGGGVGIRVGKDARGYFSREECLKFRILDGICIEALRKTRGWGLGKRGVEEVGIAIYTRDGVFDGGGFVNCAEISLSLGNRLAFLSLFGGR